MEDVIDQAQEAAEGAGDRLVNIAAVAVAVIATFMALCGVKADNMDYGIVQEQTAAVDMWAYYQSKSMKQYMYKLQSDDLQATLLVSGASLAPAARAELDKKLAKYKGEIDRYDTEKAEAQDKAKGHEANVDRMNITANQLDYTEVFLSLAISLLAIAILTRKRWLLVLALIPAVLGIVMGAIALMGLPLDIPLPGFLT